MPSVLCGGCRADVRECACEARYYWKGGKRMPLPPADGPPACSPETCASAFEYVCGAIRHLLSEITALRTEMAALRRERGA